MELEKLVKERYNLSTKMAQDKREYDSLTKQIVDLMTEPEQKVGKYRVSYKIEPIRYYYDKLQLLTLLDSSDRYMQLSEPITERVKDFFADSPHTLAMLEESKIPDGEKAPLRIVLWKHKLKKYDEAETIKEIENANNG